MRRGRPFFGAPVQHRIYVEVFEEAVQCQEDLQNCAKLKNIMCGTKAATSNWQQPVRDIMTRLAVRTGRSSPAVFFL